MAIITDKCAIGQANSKVRSLRINDMSVCFDASREHRQMVKFSWLIWTRQCCILLTLWPISSRQSSWFSFMCYTVTKFTVQSEFANARQINNFA
eukprot:scaffold162185_cov18-Prasinocladus_malaysianus.AAC.1